MATKRQQTMAKITRERAVKERRERKQEKKRAAAAARRAGSGDGASPAAPDASGSLLDPQQADGDDRAVPGEGVVSGP